MNTAQDKSALDETLARSVERLLQNRGAADHWKGRLSGSALSTATAAFALHLVDPDGHRPMITSALDWLAKHANADGGWGDTTRSASNLATTMLAWSALTAAGSATASRAKVIATAEHWLQKRVGSLSPPDLAAALARRYGKDRTFAVPILTMCALADRLGPRRRAWSLVPSLPFELAVLSHRWLRLLRLPVVSYALPALIAIGQVGFHHRRGRNPFTIVARWLARAPTLRRLERITPAGGGFLEAAPLTSFVVMSLAAMGLRDHPVVVAGVGFLERTVRPDGSWPIDTNLATWVTTLSVKALAAAGALERLGGDQRRRLVQWLLDQQYRVRHPYTGAAPGGWAWTDLSGGVSDADDTAGAMLALKLLAPDDPRVQIAARAGAIWLTGLQNRDGGIPTFCRGWSNLPFDRSGPDLTAHAVGAWRTWRGCLSPGEALRVRRAGSRAVAFLNSAQRADGAWPALWFGNEHASGCENLTYGTARVVSTLVGSGAGAGGAEGRGVRWLIEAQNGDGGWGGQKAVQSSIEETALAVEALSDALSGGAAGDATAVLGAVHRGAQWLIEHTDRGRSFPPSPIGLYFAQLWYYEELYPLIFTVSALGRAKAVSAGS